MSNGITPFNPMTLSSTVYGIAGAGISLGLLAGMAKGISDMTWKGTQSKRLYQRPKSNYNPYIYKLYKPVKINVPKIKTYSWY